MTQHTMTIAGHDVPVVDRQAVVVGTGSAGYCAAERLYDMGVTDIAIVTDRIDAGTSRNAGSDKQTYYKLTLSGGDPDSVRDMAETLFAGGAVDGDVALAEAACSTQAFLHLCELGVPFPRNRYGEYIGYKTDHDPRRRATSVGPYTSKSMVEHLQKAVEAKGIETFEFCRVVDVLVHDGQVIGLLVLNRRAEPGTDQPRFTVFRTPNIVYATGGPAGMYANSVYPNGQWGASGAPLRAGAKGKNLTEWQFGLASLTPRWNVSGTYMQVLPRFVSTNPDGSDEREFLTEAIPDYGRQLSLVFLKGYQWPFDIRKARDGSSLIDLLVYRETVLRGRYVYLDFRSNPMRPELDADALAPEAREYLDKAGALFGTPIERLRHMNEPAYQFYLDKNPGVDLEKEMLRVDVCAQHNNGGLTIDRWWRSNIDGLFPCGEVDGGHGVYRPGGSALNEGQVAALRAATWIAAYRADLPLTDDVAFAEYAAPTVGHAFDLLDSACARAEAVGGTDNVGDYLDDVRRLMSAKAGPVRNVDDVRAARDTVGGWLADYDRAVSATAKSRRSIDRVFLVRDILTSAYTYLGAMAEYAEHAHNTSRGSVLWTDPNGTLPVKGFGPDADAPIDLDDRFRFTLDGGRLDGETQETTFVAAGADGAAADVAGEGGSVTCAWRPVRPIPEDDDFFENVWRDYRETGNVD
ncbi:FAD-binding protein [Bifidobacterium biavatii]|uniref:Fumarate reductase/succinate dehydrogenase flavoprotein domain-containing protein n=1 Tax=Bifidobacterium biavatii DSM 23969 TaxID=1437608 RepID=A0A087A4R6_9BIFI|nr:FAD-binding protein [Bifidobacterium biavatii]KFI53766.1 fumarate reductase/succinate dehydrogenase flavoprotein domain-containing protein [Bifidobacterium biavatii DSM 23969]